MIFVKINIASDLVVVRGGAEPPTFRFSGLRTAVYPGP
jgi:hypothetical protein